MEELDPVIQTESLTQLRDSLAKYKRSNKQQRQKLGGTGEYFSFWLKTQALKLHLVHRVRSPASNEYFGFGERYGIFCLHLMVE
jgi:hypothetical protein